MKINDLDINLWRDYVDDLQLDTLWLIPKRDNSGAHMAGYHGNFVPQIPAQAMMRYTKAGEVVLDPFLGSGTTLIECRKRGRHGIGIELKEELADITNALVYSEPNVHNIETRVINGDSTDLELTPGKITTALETMDKKSVQLVMMHPPYHNIVKFSDLPNDISNCSSVDSFLEMYGRAVDLVTPFLDEGRYLYLIIADMYLKSETVPLSFLCMQEVLKRNYSLKSYHVKDMQNNRAKRNAENLWKRRAIQGGFDLFKHEFVFKFVKQKAPKQGKKL